MGLQSQQKLTWLKDLKSRVCILGQPVLRGMVHPSARVGCCTPLRGGKGSVGRGAAQVRRRVAVEQHVVRSLTRALGVVGARGLAGV
jgi:hypothetical protein